LQQSELGRLLSVVQQAWLYGFSLQGNFARTNSAHVAMAASMQLISTQVEKAEYSRTWRVTSKGLRWLNEHKETNANADG
jgi:hypothetical protein